MKTVLLEMESGAPRWHPRFQELVSARGITPRICTPSTPQTKGKVERSSGVVKHDFWPGVRFTDLDDLHGQAWAGAGVV
jgi:transposase